MKNIFLVWFDNDEEYIENHERYILKAFSTKLKAEKFIEKYCKERYTPDVSFEEFNDYKYDFEKKKKYLKYFEKEKSYLRYLESEENKFLYTRDSDKLSIEEINVY